MAETGFAQGSPVQLVHGGSTISRISSRHLKEKFSGNDKYRTGHEKHRTGPLVTCERKVAYDRGGGRLHQLVCPYGSGKRAGRKRAPFGADALPQELDSGALCGTRSVVLAGRDAPSASDRSFGAHGDALRGAGQGRFSHPARRAPSRTAGQSAGGRAPLG